MHNSVETITCKLHDSRDVCFDRYDLLMLHFQRLIRFDGMTGCCYESFASFSLHIPAVILLHERLEFE